MSRPVEITYLGEAPSGPLFQALPQPLCSAFGSTFEQTRELFVQSWNDYTGEGATEADFEFTQHGGRAEGDGRPSGD